MRNFPKTGLLAGFGFFVSSLLLLLTIGACKTIEQETQLDQPASQKEETAAILIPTERLDPAPYIGLSKARATELAAKRGLKYRVVSEDGKSFPITKDLRRDRLNFTIEDKKITSARLY